MKPKLPTGRTALWFRFLTGFGYLALVAYILSGLTGRDFLIVFPAVVCGALFCSAVVLFMLTRWALREESRMGQFGIGTMLILTGLVSMYFATVRWLMVGRSPGSGEDSGFLGIALGSGENLGFLGIALVCLVLAVVAIPFVLGMAESLVWFAVWTVRRPAVRRWLSSKRPRSPDQ